MSKIKQFFIVFIMIMIAFIASNDNVKAGELPVSVEGMELTIPMNL